MKANELMIGDWVSHSEGKFVQVIGNIEQYGFMSQYGYVRTDNCTPIPITEEMLIKNGWSWGMIYKLPDECYLEYIQSFHRFTRNRIFYSEGNVPRPVTSFKCYCFHVHELQHALRLCGFSNLADNFKV